MSVFLERQSVRRRRRWGLKLRQVERALLSALIVAAGLFLLYGLYRVVFLGTTFQVKQIRVEGALTAMTPEAVEELSGVRRGDNLFWLSVSDAHRRLLAAPWVRDAVVRRKLPDTIWIYVEEHKPAAILAANGLQYVEADGAVIKRVEAGEGKDYALLTGIEPDGEGSVSEEDAGRLREMLSIAELFRATGFGQQQEIAEVHYDPVEGYSLITRREPMQILIGQSGLAERIAQLDGMSRAVTERGGRIQYMLANEKGRIIVRYRQT